MIQLYCFPDVIARKRIHMLSEAAEGVLRLNTIRVGTWASDYPGGSWLAYITDHDVY